jgi:hypothetical protein
MDGWRWKYLKISSALVPLPEANTARRFAKLIEVQKNEMKSSPATNPERFAGFVSSPEVTHVEPLI